MPYLGAKPTPIPLTSSDITDGIVTTAKIADTAISTAKIADDAVTGAKIENSPSIANGLTLTDGNLVFASGHGIDFSATADASAMTSEIFDEYEEGTWTPALESTGASFSYGTQTGEYIKCGRIVFVSFRLSLGSSAPSGTTSNTTFVTGLPFTVDSTSHFGGSHVGHYFNLNKTDTDEEPAYQTTPSSSKMEIKMCGDLQGESNLTPNQMQAYFELRSNFTYLAGS